jgi:hypothetical protein
MAAICLRSAKQQAAKTQKRKNERADAALSRFCAFAAKPFASSYKRQVPKNEGRFCRRGELPWIAE